MTDDMLMVDPNIAAALLVQPEERAPALGVVVGDDHASEARRAWNSNGAYAVPRSITSKAPKRKSPSTHCNSMHFLVVRAGFECVTFKL